MVWPGLVLGILLAVGAGPDEELTAHLTILRNQVEDKTLPLGRREQLAQQVASALDRAATTASVGEVRRKYWTEASAGLDGFNKANPFHTDVKAFVLQSAIYRWASGVSLAEEAEFNPKLQADAVVALDEAIARFERLNFEISSADLPALTQNIRYRYSQALMDRSRLEKLGSEAALQKVRRANELMAAPVTAVALKGFAELLRAQILLSLGQFAEADAALNRATAEQTRPDPAALLTVRIEVLIGLKRFGEAIGAIETSKLDPVLKASQAVEVRLAERLTHEEPSNRVKVEADALARGLSLRTSNRVEARRAVVALAKEIRDPSPDESPESFDLLAEGQLRLGALDKAVKLANQGADRAIALDQKLKAAELRSRAGAIAFQAGKWSQADALFSKVVSDPEAGTFRPRAGLLIALARGRAVETRQPGASLAAFQDALAHQIKEFPTDPTASEARWLLGKQRMASHPAEAYELWGAIPPTHPRWLEARLAEADDRQEAIDLARAGADRSLIKQTYDQAKLALTTCSSQAIDDQQRIELDLRMARLLLTPGIGQPDLARTIADRWLKSSTQAGQREAARRMLVVALAEIGRLVDCERESRELVAKVIDTISLLVPARLLDQLATDHESEITRRRIGLILRGLTSYLNLHIDRVALPLRAEVRLRHARALVLSGSHVEARNALGPLSAEDMNAFNDAQLRDLADAYVRLGAHDLAADVHRLRAKHTTTGSLIWFEARYGMALSYYRAGKTQEARKLIKACVLLHPELGGAELKDKFERLSQRLNDK